MPVIAPAQKLIGLSRIETLGDDSTVGILFALRWEVSEDVSSLVPSREFLAYNLG